MFLGLGMPPFDPFPIDHVRNVGENGHVAVGEAVVLFGSEAVQREEKPREGLRGHLKEGFGVCLVRSLAGLAGFAGLPFISRLPHERFGSAAPPLRFLAVNVLEGVVHDRPGLVNQRLDLVDLFHVPLELFRKAGVLLCEVREVPLSLA